MGAVYRARSGDGELVAIKQLLDRRHSTRFEIEARLLARLRHPRVVRVVDHFDDGEGSYLVMELVRGTDLNAHLHERGSPGLPVEECVRHALEACEALQYVHEQGVLHRDVKPHNMILADQGVVLVDFGVAREADSSRTGTPAIGTPQYMAPEILAGQGVSPRSDVYGLAATLWTLIAGKPPAYQERTRLAASFEDVSENLEETLRYALEVNPERRLGSADALARALGSPLGVTSGDSLALSAPEAGREADLLEAIVRTAAGVFEAAAASIALLDGVTGELVYKAAWGAGADEIVGVRLPPGAGIATSVIEMGEGVAVPACREDPRFERAIAQVTGYVPHTMVVAPLMRSDRAIGVISILDKRDGAPYRPDDLARARMFADLATAALPRV
jgi:predicted Ser/Thr protein kinase